MILKFSLYNFLLFLVVFLLQIFVLNNVNVYSLGFPMIYPLIILVIPIRQPKYFVITVAFLAGIILDFFTNTGGLHAASLTFMAFARSFVLNKLEPQAEYGKEDKPSIKKFGFQWVFIYFSILILMHHFAYFLIEESSFLHIGTILLKTFVSAILSFIIMIAMVILIFRR